MIDDPSHHWPVRQLGDVAALVAGAGFPLSAQGRQEYELPFFKVGNLGKVARGMPLTVSAHTVSRQQAKALGARLIPAGSTVFAKIGMAMALNRRRQLAQPSCIDNNMMAAIPNLDQLEPRYLLRFLETVDLMELSRATTVPAIRKSDLERLPIPVPPKPTQRQLVALLDAVLSHSDSASVHLIAAQRAVERFRRAVLTSACSGHLTADWRAAHRGQVAVSLSPTRTRQLTAKHRLAVESFAREDLPEIPETWQWAPLAAVSDSMLGKMLDKVKNRGEPQPYLRNINVRWRGFDLSDVQEMRFEVEEEHRFGLQSGDVLVCEGGEPGRAAVWGGRHQNMRFQKALHRVRCDKALVPEWLVTVLQAHASSARLVEYFTGTGIAHLTGVSLARVPIPLPPLDEQHELVRVVERLWALADDVESRLSGAQGSVDRSSQAVLAKAFRGELNLPRMASTVNSADIAP